MTAIYRIAGVKVADRSAVFGSSDRERIPRSLRSSPGM